MGKKLAIPGLLGIPWWWLFLLGVVELILVHFLNAPRWLPRLFEFWFIGQTAWLKSAEPKSKSLGFALLSFCLTLLLNVEPLKAHLSTVWLVLFQITEGTLWVAAIFVFRDEMQKHFNQTEPIGLRLHGGVTFFFSTFYFQYWFHELWKAQNAQGPRARPEPK